eukprot:5543054-Amphidinium_carterae.1
MPPARVFSPGFSAMCLDHSFNMRSTFGVPAPKLSMCRSVLKQSVHPTVGLPDRGLVIGRHHDFDPSSSGRPFRHYNGKHFTFEHGACSRSNPSLVLTAPVNSMQTYLGTRPKLEILFHALSVAGCLCCPIHV